MHQSLWPVTNLLCAFLGIPQLPTLSPGTVSSITNLTLDRDCFDLDPSRSRS